MADITQSTSASNVNFSADTPDADQWMTERYGSHTKDFILPDQQVEATAFVAIAMARGFSIRFT